MISSAAAIGILTFGAERVASAATFDIPCTAGVGDSAALTTAVTTANTNGADDTINLVAACTYTYLAGTNDSALPAISSDTNHSLTINGNGATIARAVAAVTKFRVLAIAGGNATITGVTITGGDLGGTLHGAGISLTTGTLVLRDSTIKGNTTASYGAGIYAGGGTLTIAKSTISGNKTSADSAGLDVETGATVSVYNSTFSGNTAVDGAGGIGILGGTLTLKNTTVSGNSADIGAGVGLGFGVVSIGNTIVAGNTAAVQSDDVYEDDEDTFTDLGNNVLGSTEGTVGFTVTTQKGTAASPLNAQLNALADNGGPTSTVSLKATSPANGSGSTAICTAAPVSGVDQRGNAREATCDVGAFELPGGSVPPVPDAGVVDSGVADSGVVDSGVKDGGASTDASTKDGGLREDAGDDDDDDDDDVTPTDAGKKDAGKKDSGTGNGATTEGDDDGGCGCRTVPASTNGAFSAGLFGMILLGLRRRSRQKK